MPKHISDYNKCKQRLNFQLKDKGYQVRTKKKVQVKRLYQANTKEIWWRCHLKKNKLHNNTDIILQCYVITLNVIHLIHSLKIYKVKF